MAAQILIQYTPQLQFFSCIFRSKRFRWFMYRPDKSSRA